MKRLILILVLGFLVNSCTIESTTTTTTTTNNYYTKSNDSDIIIEYPSIGEEEIND